MIMATNQNNPQNVMVGKFKTGGYAFRAPLGTKLPTDATTALNASFVNLGFLSPDGVSVSTKTESKEFKDVNGDLVRVTTSGTEVEIKVTFVESLNPDVNRAIYGDDNVDVTAKAGATGTKMAIKVNSTGRAPGSYDFELLEDGNIIRLVIPHGVISEVGEVAHKGEELIQYPVTIKAVADEKGNAMYKYIQLNDGNRE